MNGDVLRELKSWLCENHPSKREQDRPKTVGEWKKEDRFSFAYYIRK